ncbi:MAG: DUF4131 domain-containing protein, partial [Burkholderiales bacterium]|nr:DUF4131 domain-containing protein [Burkholderiales bacterium]
MAIIPGMVWIILLLISKYIPRISLYTVLLGGIAAFFCGFGYAAKHAHTRIADELPSAWERKDITIIGVVDDLPAVNTAATRFSLHVEKVLTPNAVVPSRITLSWYRQSFDRKKTILIPNIAAGERWQLTVRLRRPHGQSNPGGFDSEAWSLQNNWRAVGYVREDGSYRRVDEFAARPYDYVQRLRETIRQKIDKTLGDKPYKGIVTALTLG